MQIKSLTNTNFATIFKAFNQAFADYEMQLNSAQLQSMLKRRGFNPDLSFAAFEDNEVVAFTLNGIGMFNGKSTAYDTGTGTLKEHRGKGLATKIFEYSIPYLRKAGIQQYLLEVLQHNTKAVSVYTNLGFKTTREFNYFIQQKEEINNEIKTTDVPCSVQQIDIEKFDPVFHFWDFHPSWQNSFESIKRAAETFVCLCVFTEKTLIGYCIFEPLSGDLAQIAVDQQYRRKGIASLLLYEIIKLNKNDTIRIINTDIMHNAITEFLSAKNIAVKGKQFEMIKNI